VKVHLVDGTYELFRAYYGAPGSKRDGREIGASRALLRSLARMVHQEGATHVAVAFDTVVESFRNALFGGYKTGEGIDPDLFSQFPLAERLTHALGMVVWPMVEHEADDALATGAHRYAEDPRVEQVVICSPDKDLAQCVRGSRIVMWDRKNDRELDEAAVVEKFGVSPASIPDYLALVGDAADGIPGIPRWGRKSAAAVLSRWGHVDAIPADPAAWELKVRGAVALSANLEAEREAAALYRTLAVLRTDVPLGESVDDLAWLGARRSELEEICVEVGERTLMDRVARFRED